LCHRGYGEFLPVREEGQEKHQCKLRWNQLTLVNLENGCLNGVVIREIFCMCIHTYSPGKLALVTCLLISFYVVCFCASTQHSMAGGMLLLFCSSMSPYVHPKALLTRYLAECLTHFRQTYISNALWDKDECATIWGSKGQRSKSRWNKVCWKLHFLGLLTQYLEKY